MRTTSGKITSITLKKKLSNQIPTIKQSTSTQSVDSKDDNTDKLIRLKQKLEQQRQNMRKSGRRFKQHTTSIADNSFQKTNQIQIQTQNSQEDNINKSINNVNNNSKVKNDTIKTKTTTSVGSTAASSLYDFNSIKNQVQSTKTNKLFMKKPANKSNQIVYTAQKLFTPAEIINRDKKIVNMPIKQKNQTLKNTQKKKDTINLMQISSVIQKNVQSCDNNNSKQKPTTYTNSTNKFVQLTKNTQKVTNSHNNQILGNSKVFQSAIKEQKKRNKQIEQFLAQVQLQEFAEHFINLGYDEIDTIIEVQVDELNQMMMRAFQQDRLVGLIKKYKKKHQIQTQPEQPLIARPSTIHSRIDYRPKSASTTQPSENSYTSSSRLLNNLNSSTLLNKSSIFYSIGDQDWSLQSQIRRACSGCFKVCPSNQINKRGQCYYCVICDPGEFNLDFINLDESMVREFKK